MPRLPQIRGAFLEEIILYLLNEIGYEIVQPGEPGTRNSNNGTEVQGRGEWHQIDGYAKLKYTPAFMYPLRLILEAKCYKTRPVTIKTVRNSVGVHKDISENYFTFSNQSDDPKFQRYNYHSAIFSTSGYSKGAQNYALAHQVFLIQYHHVRLLQPITQTLHSLNENHFRNENLSSINLTSLRLHFRNLLRDEFQVLEDYINNSFSEEGYEDFVRPILRELRNINGSYFGTLQGKYPMHLLSETSLPPEAFSEADELECRVGRWDNGWSFRSPNDALYFFNLEFDLPKHIADVIRNTDDPEEIANQKRQEFSYIDIAGKIDGIFRMVRLKLDQNWLDDYLQNLDV